jgi:hypothetical protein
MSKSTWLLTFAATSLVMVPLLTSVQAEPIGSAKERVKKNLQTNSSLSDPSSASRAGATCSRAIDCERWPPPIYDDPDRKAGGAGGM